MTSDDGLTIPSGASSDECGGISESLSGRTAADAQLQSLHPRCASVSWHRVCSARYSVKGPPG